MNFPCWELTSLKSLFTGEWLQHTKSKRLLTDEKCPHLFTFKVMYCEN